jgi:tripartite-type tricarboxylate transporter receptor subunit TctC
MKTSNFLRAGVVCTISGLLGGNAVAQAPYPSKPIRMVVPFQAGGATDVLARVLGEAMSAKLGQPILIDNKAGAAGIIGTDAVAKAAPDGHTIMLGLSNSLLTNQFLYTKLPYDAQKDLVMVYRIAMAPLVLVVNPSVPAKNTQDLLKYLQANKGKVAYGSYGTGAYPHLAGAHMSQWLNADMSHVAYKGEAPMVQDLIGGQIQMAFASALQVKAQVQAGKLRAIGVSGDKRMATMPETPTLAEQGLKDEAYRVTGWLAIAAPGGTPKPIVDRLALEVRNALKQPDVRERVTGMGFEIQDNGTPEAFLAAYRQELPIWYRLIKASGARLD